MIGEWKGELTFQFFPSDPNKENLNDIEDVLKEQSKTLQIGHYGLGTYSFYVEEMKAAPFRYFLLSYVYIFIYHLDTDALTLAEFIQDSHRASRNSINFYIVKTIFLDSVDTWAKRHGTDTGCWISNNISGEKRQMSDFPSLLAPVPVLQLQWLSCVLLHTLIFHSG